MNYYSFHIGDYRRDTGHLSLLEHGIYRQLLDWLYLDQRAIPKETETVMRRLCARTEEERNAVIVVLNEFFVLRDGGYVQDRVLLEINEYEAKAERARQAGKLGGRPKKTEEVISGLSKETEEKANHKPLTINQEPIKKEKKESASRLPPSWQPSEEEIEFCKTRRPDLDVNDVAESFRDFWTALPESQKARKLDWSATWRTWVKRQDAPKQKASGETTYQRSMREKIESVTPLIAAKAPRQSRPVDLSVFDKPKILENA